MNLKLVVGLILVLFLILPVLAAPTTPTVSAIGSNNVTFSSSGSGTVWFRWGANNQNPEWRTPNQTASGAFSAIVYGSPYYPGVIYYVQACDSTGCTAASSVSFTSAQTTPLPQTTYGVTYDNITQNGFNIIFITQGIATPYFWEFPGLTAYAMALCASLILAFYFIGLWLRQRKVSVASLLGMMILAFFISGSAGFGWGMEAAVIALAQMVLYLALAAVIMGLIKKG
jgi:hypothetical protein